MIKLIVLTFFTLVVLTGVFGQNDTVIADTATGTLEEIIALFEEIVRTGNLDLIDENFNTTQHLEAIAGNEDQDMNGFHDATLGSVREEIEQFRGELIAKGAKLDTFATSNQFLKEGYSRGEEIWLFYFTHDDLIYEAMSFTYDTYLNRYVFGWGFGLQIREKMPRK